MRIIKIKKVDVKIAKNLNSKFINGKFKKEKKEK